mgnify:CR=1 FL=1
MNLVPDLDWCKGEGCNLLKPIVNKHYTLCDSCNYKRLHKGKDKQEVYRERHDKKNKDKQSKPKLGSEIDKSSLVRELKKTFSINKISNKKAERDRLMKIAYREIDRERDPVCEGCGRGDVALSHSHILSQANRKDLAAEKDNIKLHCLGNYYSCHETWERGIPHEIVLMDDFKENLAYIEMLDKDQFIRIMIKLEEANIKI